MIRFTDHRPMDTVGINVTPLVDVVFILLIFFLLTANSSRGIVLDLPDATTGETIPEQSWQIAITDTEALMFNGVEVKKGRLEGILAAARRQEQTQRLVILKAHRDASVNAFVSVMDIVRKTGFYNLVIATDIKPDER